MTPTTYKPDTAWMRTQAKAFLSHTEEQRLGCSIVMRDRDGKYVTDFDRVFTERAIRVKPVGPQAPNLNAFIERWIQSVKHEALDPFILFGLAHFDQIVSEYVSYYHDSRPHQGIGKRLLCDDEGGEPPAVVSLDQIRCETRLGGLLKHYHRAA